MLQILYRPISPIFTASLPTQITITTDSDAAIDISVEIEGATGFSTVLYPYNGKAVFHDLRSIVEQTMLADTRPFLSVILFAEQGTESTNTPECICIYSRLAVSQSGLAFTSQHFLTTAQSFLLPRSATQHLSYFSPNAYEADDYTDCVVRPHDGSMPKTVRVSEGTFTVKANDIYSVLVSPQSLQEQVATDGTLLAFTIHRGSRSKTFYLTDTAPNLTLQLLNEFLVPEYIHLHCITKTKLSLDRSLATSQGSLSFYDDTSADEYESETAMLTPYEARRLSRLLLSSTIKAALTDIGTSLPISIPNSQSPIPIIVTDLTSDISDAHNATNTVKFKWKYRTPQFPHTVPYPSNIFDDPFARPFD